MLVRKKMSTALSTVLGRCSCCERGLNLGTCGHMDDVWVHEHRMGNCTWWLVLSSTNSVLMSTLEMYSSYWLQRQYRRAHLLAHTMHRS